VAIAYSIIWGDKDVNPQTNVSGGPGQPQLPGMPLQPPGRQAVPLPPGTPVPPGFHLDPNGQIVADNAAGPYRPGGPGRTNPQPYIPGGPGYQPPQPAPPGGPIADTAGVRLQPACTRRRRW
jgi:hypothetical protein